MNLRQITDGLYLQLTGQYPDREIACFVQILFKHYLNMSPAQVQISQENELSSEIEQNIVAAIDQLKKNHPIQYIVGETEFYGLHFHLTPDVLIPRPETEELVDWMVRRYDRNSQLTIVDIGTGSGCIAVALATNFPNSEVWAVDISEAALVVAQKNARKNGIKVNFLLKDVLKNGQMGFTPASLDVVVSNPPYVAPSEKKQMLPNVLEHEPHVALFTPKNNPLIFYERIAEFGKRCLKAKGRIYFEINEAYSEKVANILKTYHYSDIIPRKDINGKWRMMSAVLSVEK